MKQQPDNQQGVDRIIDTAHRAAELSYGASLASRMFGHTLGRATGYLSHDEPGRTH